MGIDDKKLDYSPAMADEILKGLREETNYLIKRHAEVYELLKELGSRQGELRRQEEAFNKKALDFQNRKQSVELEVAHLHEIIQLKEQNVSETKDRSEKKHEDIKKHYTDLVKDLKSDYDARINSFNKDADEYNREITALKSQLKVLSAEYAKINIGFDSEVAAQVVVKLKERIQYLDDEYKKLYKNIESSILSQYQEQITIKEEKIKLLAAENKQISAELSGTLAKLDNTNIMVEKEVSIRLKAQLVNIKKDYDELHTTMLAELESEFNTNIQTLKNINSKLTNQVSEFAAQKDVIEQDNVKLKREKNSIITECDGKIARGITEGVIKEAEIIKHEYNVLSSQMQEQIQKKYVVEINNLQSEQNKITSELLSLKSVINDYKVKLVDKSDENLSLSARIKILESEKDRALNDLSNENGGLSLKLKDILVKNKNLEIENKNLQEKITDAETIVQENRKQLDDIKRSIELLKQEKTGFRQKLQAAADKNDELLLDQQEYTFKIQQLETRIQQSAESYLALQSENNKLQIEKEKVMVQMHSVEATKDKNIKSAVAEMEQQVIELEAQLAEKNKKIDTILTKKDDEITVLIKKYEAEKNRVIEQAREQTKISEKLKVERSRLTQEIDDFDSIRSAFEEKSVDYENQITVLETRIQKILEEKESESNTYSASIEQLKNTTQELSELKAEYIAYKANMQERNDQLSVNNGKNEIRVKGLQTEIDMLHVEKETQQKTASEAGRNDLDRITSLEKQNNDRQQAIVDLEAKINSRNKEFQAQLLEQEDIWQKRLEKETSDLKKQKVQLLEQVEQLKDDLDLERDEFIKNIDKRVKAAINEREKSLDAESERCKDMTAILESTMKKHHEQVNVDSANLARQEEDLSRDYKNRSEQMSAWEQRAKEEQDGWNSRLKELEKTLDERSAKLNVDIRKFEAEKDETERRMKSRNKELELRRKALEEDEKK